MKSYTLVPQSYGIAMAQCRFGCPLGVWLECRSCDRSDKIKGASAEMSDTEAAKIFRQFGWTGNTDRMLAAKCPDCNKVSRGKAS